MLNLSVAVSVSWLTLTEPCTRYAGIKLNILCLSKYVISKRTYYVHCVRVMQVLNSPVAAAAPSAARNTAHTGEAAVDVHMARSFCPPSSAKHSSAT